MYCLHFCVVFYYPVPPCLEELCGGRCWRGSMFTLWAQATWQGPGRARATRATDCTAKARLAAVETQLRLAIQVGNKTTTGCEPHCHLGLPWQPGCVWEQVWYKGTCARNAREIIRRAPPKTTNTCGESALIQHRDRPQGCQGIIKWEPARWAVDWELRLEPWGWLRSCTWCALRAMRGLQVGGRQTGLLAATSSACSGSLAAVRIYGRGVKRCRAPFQYKDLWFFHVFP